MYSVHPSIHRLFHIISLCLCILLFGWCDSSDIPKQPLREPANVETVRPFILRALGHDKQAFTQGLFCHDGRIYESTGIRGKSSLRVIEADKGTLVKNIPVDNVFAEGIALKNNVLVQLTWRSERAILYSYPDLAVKGMYTYSGEGWGITTDGTCYIMSNGSDTLYWRDDAFTVKKKTGVLLRGKPLTRLNELEYARNRIFVNVWYSDYIFEIDPETGKVVRMIDCGNLLEQVSPLGPEDVLNGIAYNKKTDTFYLTGKNWPKIFEVKIPE